MSESINKAQLWFIMLGFVICGTCTTVISKVLYQSSADEHKFRKPLFQNLTMFFGMSLCLLVYEIQQCRQHYYININNNNDDDNDMIDDEGNEYSNNNNNNNNERSKSKSIEPLIDVSQSNYGTTTTTSDNTSINNDKELNNNKVDRSVYFKIVIPAFCDFVATQMLNVGLLWIHASIWQMCRGSIILWTALFRRIWLKKSIKKFEILSIFLVVIALIIIGIASILAPHSSSDATNSTGLKVLGVILVVFSQAVQATQTVIEEKLLHDLETDELVVVGMEGIWGFILSGAIAVPISAYLPGQEGNGLHEDTIDTFDMLRDSKLILILSILYIFFILFFNLFGLKITKYTHSVTRNIMDSVRTISIWMCVLLIHYEIDDKVGESWTNYSYVQLFGFIVLLTGILTYREVFRLPYIPLSWYSQ